jgi:hypothetical protein
MLALGLGTIVVVLVATIAMQPSSSTIARSATTQAPADVVHGQIESPRPMDTSSPWARMDPQMKTLYEGPEAGVGARSSWEGPEMGKGLISITAVKPNQEVEMKLEMLASMEATNRVVFTLALVGEGIDVTWRIEGTNGRVGKAIALFMNMDETVGGEFEKGLPSLKPLADAARRNAE